MISTGLLKSEPHKLIILADMMFNLSGIVKRNISLIMIILLTVVFCGSIDLTCDSFSSGGGIKGSSGISVSHSLIAFPSATVREGNNGGNGNDQNLEEEIVTYNIFCRIAKKLLALFGCDLSRGCGQKPGPEFQERRVRKCILMMNVSKQLSCIFNMT